jgi:hypothetical protein
MALAPAYDMSRELPEARRALPVFKVLHRNTRFIHANVCRAHEVLHPVEPAALPPGRNAAELLREAQRARDWNKAESTFAALAQDSLDEAYNDLQYLIQDDADVHRVVLAWRSWALKDITGKEHAHTLLRQSVRYCLDSEDSIQANLKKYPAPGIRHTLPTLLDQYHLLGRPLGTRQMDDDWVEKTGESIYAGSREQAAETAASALADGIGPDSIVEATCQAANLLLLRDPGRPKPDTGTDKIKGSVHGSSWGVHASDAANAWRNIAKVSNSRNTVASLIVAAYHTAGQSGHAHEQSYPWAEHLEKIKSQDSASLLHEAEEAIRCKDQGRAAALVHTYGKLGHPARPVFDLLLRYATSEDGALHAEKYYRTVTEEFALARPSFKWRQLVALARVTASEYGTPAPGYAEACELLKVTG